MRETKFKAKVADEPNEWVIGYLCSKDTIYQEKEHEGSKCCGTGTFKVREETIGQYTGLKDKNGVEIYEGDIVKTKENKIYQVVYAEDIASFECITKVGSVSLFALLSRRGGVEILGNIYENPELLEAENE